MFNFYSACGKYIILLIFAAFVVFSVISLLRGYKKDKKSLRITQIVLLLLFHLACFAFIFLQISVGNAAGLSSGSVLKLYIGQVLFLVLMAVVIPLFTELNRSLNLVMCMFITIGFVIQTRLDFDVAVRQFFIMLLGAAMFFVFVFFCKRARFMRNMTWAYFGVSAALLVLVLVLAQYSHGAKLAIDLGFISFQPMEFVKILFVLFVAAAFHKANSIKTVIITAVCAAIHCGILALCNDLGSALTIFVIYVLMAFVARKNILYIVGGAVGLVAAGFAGYKLFPHVRVRMSSWLDPWSDIDNKGYQIAQSLFAIGTGGWFGVGLFGGSPNSIPVVNNDFVFSAICEEMGGLFGIFLILLCLCFALMMMKIAIRIEMVFYKLLAFGLAATYAFQVFLTIGGVIKFIPSTGMNLPLISSGGSSVLGSMIIFGMIQALYVLSVNNKKVKGASK